jgi:hypothetical protein
MGEKRNRRSLHYAPELRAWNIRLGFALYQGTTSVVPPPVKMGRGFRVCVRTCWCNFCPDHESKGAPRLARFSRDAPNFLRAAPDTIACAAFIKESRMKFATPTSSTGNRGCGAPVDSWHHEILRPVGSHADSNSPGFSRPALKRIVKVQPFSATLKRCSPLLKQRAPTKLEASY